MPPPQWVDEAVIHEKFVLDADPLRRSSAALFKIPRLATSRVFVVEGLRPPEEEFRALVERAQLRGLEWQCVC